MTSRAMFQLKPLYLAIYRALPPWRYGDPIHGAHCIWAAFFRGQAPAKREVAR